MDRPPAPASLVQILNSAEKHQTHLSPSALLTTGGREATTRKKKGGNRKWRTEKKKRRQKEEEEKKKKKRRRREGNQPTWDPCDSSVQAGPSCSDLVGPSLSQGPHSELEGAAGDVLAAVLDIDSVGSHFLRDEAHAVGAAPSIHNVSIQGFPTGAGHLSRHGLGATLNWRRRSSTEDVFRHNLDICT